MKQRIVQAIDQAREQILACGEYVLNNPELGFKEEKTSQYVKKEFERLGIPYRDGLAITGVMGVAGVLALVVAFVAVLFALRPALTVRPLDAQDARPHRRRHGMAIAFACGFAAFVAGMLEGDATPAELRLAVETLGGRRMHDEWQSIRAHWLQPDDATPAQLTAVAAALGLWVSRATGFLDLDADQRAAIEQSIRRLAAPGD